MLKEIIIEQNKHWQHKYKSYIKRDALDKLISYLPLKQIITITGIRRCGKSTLAKQLINYLINNNTHPQNILFLNLEQPFFLNHNHNAQYLDVIFNEYLKLCNPQGRVYVFFDEIQFFHNWQVYIKSQYENNNIKYILTGSNSSMLSNELNTLLSGRSLNVHLQTFSFSEFLNYKNIDYSNEIARTKNKILIARAKDEYLLWGGFYEVFNAPDDEVKRDILLSYTKNIIYQDIIPRYKIRNNEIIEKLLFYLLENPGLILNYTTLANTFNISDKTIKEYLKYLEEVFLIARIDKFHHKTKEMIKSSKKVYILDNGLLQLSLRNKQNMGNSLENWVFNILFLPQNLYYLKEDKEIDFYENNNLYQVCFDISDANTKKREIVAFNSFATTTTTKNLITYDNNNNIDDIKVISIDNFALK
jgi:predicted AAA+ superfamily ATPase